MQWILENWILVALVGGMGAMHLFGHGKGKGKGGCGGHKQHTKDGDAEANSSPNGRADNEVNRNRPDG